VHRTVIRESNNGYLIAGVLVFLLSAGLFFLLWRSINAHFFWVILAGWLILPLIPFAMAVFAQNRRTSSNLD
jgi:cyanate permease